MRNIATRFAACAAIVAALAAPPAGAHPHVWIDGKAEFAFEPSGRLASVAIRWTFDEMYSVFAVQGLDKNRDGKIDAAELAPMVDDMMANLKSFGYFTVLRADGEAVNFAPPVGAGAAFANGVLQVQFILPLMEPIDARRAEVTFAMYDPSYYVAVEVAGDQAVRLSGAAPQGCAGRIVKSPTSIEVKPLSEALFQDAAAAGSIAAAFARWIYLSCPESGGKQ
jgi:ABC-type uncharacterized transport system substrate-binding protein